MQPEFKINIVGGSAFSSTGGIQAMNRVLTQELASAKMLRKAFFLWDEPGRSEMTYTPQLVGFGRNRRKFAQRLLREDLFSRQGFWLCTHVNYALLTLVASRWNRRNVAVLVHAAELDEGMTRAKRFALRRVGRVIAVSEFTRKKVRRLGVDPARAVVLHNGVSDPCPGGPPMRDANSPVRVLFVGRMDEFYKGQAELLDAMVLLRSRHPQLRLIFVGPSTSVDRWEQKAREKRIDDSVEFAGRVSEEELQRQFARATMFAMPSRNEGFGLVYAQAMAYGLPCIGSERDGACEVIAHGETGWCVPADNSIALAAAIDHLASDREARIRMGIAGRARFVANYTMQRYRERLLASMHAWQQMAMAKKPI